MCGMAVLCVFVSVHSDDEVLEADKRPHAHTGRIQCHFVGLPNHLVK